MNEQPEWASGLARSLLAGPLPRRWTHTQGVAERARSIAPILDDRADIVEAAAWLHDIGYSPDLVDTGFHPLDGARFLRDSTDADSLLCQLVAHHTGAIFEAQERGLADILRKEFHYPPLALLNALNFSDVTTSPDGHAVNASERIAEIRSRYAPDHPVSRAIEKTEMNLLSAVEDVERRIDGYPH